MQGYVEGINIRELININAYANIFSDKFISRLFSSSTKKTIFICAAIKKKKFFHAAVKHPAGIFKENLIALSNH